MANANLQFELLTRKNFLIETFFQLFNLDKNPIFENETLEDFMNDLKKLMDATGVQWFAGETGKEEFEYRVNTVAMGNDFGAFRQLCEQVFYFKDLKGVS